MHNWLRVFRVVVIAENPLTATLVEYLVTLWSRDSMKITVKHVKWCKVELLCNGGNL